MATTKRQRQLGLTSFVVWALAWQTAIAADVRAKKPGLATGADYWESYAPQTPSLRPTAFDITDRVKVESIVEAPLEYAYAAFDKPSPFDPPPLAEYLSKLEVPITSVLQKYPCGQLQAVGIWLLENKQRRALITTPDAKGVMVSIGDFVGNRGGRVAAINAQRILVREFTLAPDGNRHFEDHALWLGGKDPSAKQVIILPSRRVQASPTTGQGKGYLETTPLQKSREEKVFRKVNEAQSLQEGDDLAGSSSAPPTNMKKPSTPKGQGSQAMNDSGHKGEVHVNNPAHPSADGL